MLSGREGSYLLMPGAPDVSGVGICPRAPHGTEPAVQPRLHPTRAATGLGARLLGRLFLFVLLPFQVLAVGLQVESESGPRGMCVRARAHGSLVGEPQACHPPPSVHWQPRCSCAPSLNPVNRPKAQPEPQDVFFLSKNG